MTDVQTARAKGEIATASIEIDSSADKVWHALTTPAEIKEYMFGSTVESEWKVGSPITFSGEFKGKPYEDKGEILEIEPSKRLSYSHFSPLAGKPDVPENYHTVSIDLDETRRQNAGYAGTGQQRGRKGRRGVKKELAANARRIEEGSRSVGLELFLTI